ncbi:MAG: Crotonobetainyl-CoA dehydrogenase [Myxococcota bacterium]|nr:Crotonobetainyl-CoA dehydrogenase [Myxococcota bacterium]
MSQALPANRITSARGFNYFETDAVLQRVLLHFGGASLMDQARPLLVRMGELAGTRGADLADEADRDGPVHIPYDRFGERVDEIRRSRAYEELVRLAYGEGIIGNYYPAALGGVEHPLPHLVKFAQGYVFAQSEQGLYCPICMTDGVARVLARHAAPEIQREVIPHLVSRDYGQLHQGAMFLTEKQGGSDVGANTCRAVRDGEHWRLHGDKWFCSNVHADQILVLARPEGAPPGTRGLGLFLLSRRLPDGSPNRYRINRLKDKFGTRSMPTGEVTLEGAAARAIGRLDHGFKTMAEMVNLSRLYNSVASLACMRRALNEALVHCARRSAFGALIEQHPLMREQLIQLHLEYEGAMALVFRCVHALDRGDAGDAGEQRLVRALTPLCKLTTADQAVRFTWAAMDILGGNGYVNEFVTTRLLRDAHVLPIWEGSAHIQKLDFLRGLHKEGAGEALAGEVRACLRRAGEAKLVSPSSLRALAEAAARVESQLAESGKASAEEAQLLAGRLAPQAAHLMKASLLCALASPGDRRSALVPEWYISLFVTGEALSLDAIRGEYDTVCHPFGRA